MTNSLPVEDGSRRCVFIVEDQAVLRRLLRHSLAALEVSLGLEFKEFVDADSAWQQAQLEMPDLFILDVMLPGRLDGVELCRAVKQLSSVPVLIVSARGQLSDKQRASEAGADAYMVKPFSPASMREQVKELVTTQR